MNKSKIAVVGMAFRFGDVSNIDELHALLIEKKECVKERPADVSTSMSGVISMV